MSAEAAEIPPKPNNAATSDTTRKNNANLNMTDIHSVTLRPHCRISAAGSGREPLTDA